MHDDLLLDQVRGYGRTLVAFSGGADSALVLAACVRALGQARVAAVTGVSPAVPPTELAAARAFAAELGVRHLTPSTSELSVAGYRDNGRQRCFFCKTELLTVAGRVAQELGGMTIATGTNADDVRDGFRPGIGAAARLGARTPLADAGIDKAQVRAISRRWGLATWDKPALACLSSRIAYGLQITSGRLVRVAHAEAALRGALTGHGVRDLRVRDLGDQVRVEVDAALVTVVAAVVSLTELLREAGFGELPVQVRPFRSGSMNELPERAREGEHAGGVSAG